MSVKPAQRPKLEVIQGSWVAAPKWLDFPRFIEARSPVFGLEFCKFRVAKNDVTKASGLRRRTPAYLLWSALFGQVPPVPHDVVDPNRGLTKLRDAHACFRGLKRPCAEDGSGENYVAYVLKANFVYEYEAKPPLLFLNRVSVPNDVVLVAYVRLDEPAVQNGVLKTSAPSGVLTHWDFVPVDEEDSSLPQNFRERYVERLW